MRGRVVGLVLVLSAMVAGGAMYWLQVYAFYDTPTEAEAALALGGVPLAGSRLEAIDSGSSPIRFRACFRLEGEALADALAAPAHPDPTPLNAPYWFECFEAVQIGADLQSGAARAVMATRDIADGVDRVLAVYPDGRAFAWHQLNETWRD
ncbi:MAG: histidine kinase [Rhodobacteraceae bacterium]|nr:histidine kinase [Paracoccaceae bacterium]